MNNKVVLVTGGAGFIGSHLVDKLVEMGASVRVVDDLSFGKESNLDAVRSRIDFVKGDIRDKALVRELMGGVNYVFHQAALRSVPRSMDMPWEYNDVNVNGTLNLLIAARDAGVEKFVFASSSSVYGDTGRLPQTETDHVRPISPYAMTKLIGERYCQLFYDAYGLRTVSLRYFNVFGPRQSLENEYAVVVPKFIVCMLNGKNPPVYGDGHQTRDFTFVSDVVDANIAAALASGCSGEVYNAAAGDSKSVLDIFEALKRSLGVELVPEFLPPRPGDVRHTKANPLKIEQELGWHCKVGFEEGLKRTIAYFRERV